VAVFLKNRTLNTFNNALKDTLQPAFVKTSAGTASSRQVFTAELDEASGRAQRRIN